MSFSSLIKEEPGEEFKSVESMEHEWHHAANDTSSVIEKQLLDEEYQAVATLIQNTDGQEGNGMHHHHHHHHHHSQDDEPRKRKRKGEDDDDDEDDEDLSEESEELARGGPIDGHVLEMSQEDKASMSRKQAQGWIQKNFVHNFTANYTGISKDFVYQLYHHSFGAESALMSVPQFTRLFNDVMYKGNFEYNPRARKTPSNQVLNELFPLLGVTLEVVEKTFGHKDKRITYFQKVSLAPHIKELKDCLVTGTWSQQVFLESLRNYKRSSTESKENRTPRKRQSMDSAVTVISQLPMSQVGLSDHRIYSSDKYIVVALDIPGVDPNEIEISFPTDRSIRVAHKEGTKTYEETALLENNQFQLIGGALRRGNILSVPREIQLQETIEVPHPSNTATPFIHDHYGTVLFKFLRKFQQEEPYLKSYWSKEPLKFE